MTGAPAEEEINEPTGKFLRPGSDIAYSLRTALFICLTSALAADGQHCQSDV